MVSKANVNDKKRKTRTALSKVWDLIVMKMGCKMQIAIILRSNSMRFRKEWNYFVEVPHAFFPKKHLDESQIQLVFQSEGNKGEKALVPWKFDYDVPRKAVAKMIIIIELAFKFENINFLRLMPNVCPNFIYCQDLRKTVFKDLLN